MKSVKSKLFISYTLTIFVILLALCLLSIYFFNKNKQNSSIELVDKTSVKIEKFIENNSKQKIQDIDSHIDLENQFLIIFEDDNIIFTNKSKHKTQKILKHIYKDDDDHKHKHNHEDFFKADDYVLDIKEIEKGEYEYIFYLGIDEKYLDDSLEEVYFIIVVSNIVIFLILTILGFLLINKTINPLKQILNELKTLQNSNDLSQRLKENKTNDEFEQLINSFNTMLENIQNSVENIKQFTSDASHELKTPLTVIQGQIDLCKKEDITKEQLVQTLQKIDEEQKKLQEIIKDFLLLSRLDKDEVKNKKAMLDKVLFEAIELHLEKLEEKNLELKLDIQEELEVNFDEKHLQIVVNNLISNAIKYTNKGYISLEAKKLDKSIVLEVQDSGIGISKTDQNKIFERFYRVDKARRNIKDGIGLGLAIVKKICDKYECKITLKSEQEKGTTFNLTFK